MDGLHRIGSASRHDVNVNGNRDKLPNPRLFDFQARIRAENKMTRRYGDMGSVAPVK
jgi:hypothetical protein